MNEEDPDGRGRQRVTRPACPSCGNPTTKAGELCPTCKAKANPPPEG